MFRERNVASIMPFQVPAALAVSLLTMTAMPLFAAESQAALQVSPQGGDHCVEVAGRHVTLDQQLQMADCDGSAAQSFSYDRDSMHVTIAGFCVDAGDGAPGEIVKLWACHAGPSQAWKVELRGNLEKLVGLNGLCLDVRYGSTERGALVQSWNCTDAAPNQLWTFRGR